MAKPQTARSHIKADRLWSFHSEETELRLPETMHLVNCQDCRDFLDACFRAETLDEALGIWHDENPIGVR